MSYSKNPARDSLATTEQRFKKGRVVWPSLLLLLVAGAPAQLPPDPPGPVVLGLMGTVVAGDTLTYRISWGAGAHATSYDVTYSVAATNGTWAVRDSNAGGWTNSTTSWPPLPFTWTSAYTTQKAWLTAVPWDSATFTVTVASRNNLGVSAAVATTWRVLRKPGVPGPILVDSSLIVTGVLLQPPSMNLVVGQTKRVCAYPQFWDGAVATQTGALGCDSLRLSLWTPPSVRQQAHTDSMCFLWATSNPVVATIASAPCTVGMRPDLIWRVASRSWRATVRPTP